MDSAVEQAFKDILLALADDQMVLAHRNSEWCGHAPILEEDIALANIALDEMGHAKIWYSLIAEMEKQDSERRADEFVFFRDADAFRNAQMVELPKGDWAFTMMRQFLFDSVEHVQLESLAAAGYKPIAQAAAKMIREESYHWQHTSAWIKRLALGTDESHARTQRALESLWPFTRQFFAPVSGQDALTHAGLLPALASLEGGWEISIRTLLDEWGLQSPSTPNQGVPSRTEHTEHLADLVREMQETARSDPTARW